MDGRKGIHLLQRSDDVEQAGGDGAHDVARIAVVGQQERHGQLRVLVEAQRPAVGQLQLIGRRLRLDNVEPVKNPQKTPVSYTKRRETQ